MSHKYTIKQDINSNLINDVTVEDQKAGLSV